MDNRKEIQSLVNELHRNDYTNVYSNLNKKNQLHYYAYASKGGLNFSFDYVLYGDKKGFLFRIRDGIYKGEFGSDKISSVNKLVKEVNETIEEIHSIYYKEENPLDELSSFEKDDYTLSDNNELELKSESLLLEITRKQMIDKSKKQSDKSKERFKRRSHYQGNISLRDLDFSKFYTDDLLVATAKVGDYYNTIAFQGVILRMKDLVKDSSKHILAQQIIIKAVSSAIDESDLLINCDCGDFTYRFAYWATKLGYKWGKPETRPAEKTNSKDLLGSCCKHLLAILSNKKWTTQIAIGISDYVYKQGVEDLRKAMAYDKVQLPNEVARELGKQGAYTKMYNKQFKDQDREAEELELKGDNDNA